MIAPLNSLALVRYGRIPEVVRCRLPGDLSPGRGTRVVVRTHRGLELGSVVELVRRRPERYDERKVVEKLERRRAAVLLIWITPREGPAPMRSYAHGSP